LAIEASAVKDGQRAAARVAALIVSQWTPRPPVAAWRDSGEPHSLARYSQIGENTPRGGAVATLTLQRTITLADAASVC
jgi:hypothetical protein